jgi:GNAT superfamily N-acetyltransferase
MLRACTDADLDAILAVVNDAAQAYKGVIPADCWHEPYMDYAELEAEIAAGVRFWGWEEGGGLAGVMGLQDRGEVDLIRHAYVRTRDRRRGIGARLLAHVERLSEKPILIGTWAAARWAIDFYEKHEYRVLAREDTERLLRRYWRVPERQIATSVVLASARWGARR